MFLLVGAGALPDARDLVTTRTNAAIMVTVSPADTLWSIAAAHRLPGVSTAQTADAIIAANGVRAGRLVAGMVLRVPSEGTPETAFAQVTSHVSAR